MKKLKESETRGGARQGAGRKPKAGARIAINLSDDSLRELDEIQIFLLEQRRINSDQVEERGGEVEKLRTRTDLIEMAIQVAYARIVGLESMRRSELARLRAQRERRDAIARGEDLDD